MCRWLRVLLGIAAAWSPAAAWADELEQSLGTLWEVLWHQSGTPTRVVRWESELRLRYFGVNAAVHKQHTLAALRAVTREAGVRLVDVSDQPDQVPNLTVEITGDNALEDSQPCVTVLNFRDETRIDTATIQMRNKDAWRCAYHEAMHLMGVRGHPAGKTVLSYFPIQVDALQPLDKVMLRAWYSPRMRAGMTPFEALPVLADELLAAHPDPAAGQQGRERFFANTVAQSRAYASGKGDIPAVVKRSGKSTEDGVRYGRSEMSYFLGVAYQEGVTVGADAVAAQQWFERAASAGNRRALARLGAMR